MDNAPLSPSAQRVTFGTTSEKGDVRTPSDAVVISTASPTMPLVI